MTPTSQLCPTAKIISSILDGASERALLLASDGTVLHRNEAAEHFLCKGSSITQILACPAAENNRWWSLDHCRIVMADGTTTRSERNIHWVTTECPCCPASTTYYTAYICTKHERVREVVDHALDPVITINDRGIIVTANDAATDLFQYTEGELVGHNISMLCGGEHAKKHDAYLQNYLQTGVRRIIGKKREVTAKKKDGTEVPCELGIQEIKDVSTGNRFFCGFFKDLTLLKQHEAMLQEKQALAQAMVNASFDGMVEIDQQGIIQIVNDAACNMFGYTREEFLGSNISLICGDGHAKNHDAYLQRYMETGQKRVIGQKRQVKARRKDGTELEVELGVQEVTLFSGKKAFCGFIRDMTQQRKDKRALRKQQQLIHGKFFGGEE
ncbi:Sensor protein FixL [Seminavis robusta]|uniref:Sensor protein FixL n=2 Tax=Seminavis robusta TaxID=568900 RepID=A0A9N8DXS6_9STRA|nr:Sensor protein FixL [Seminavis robusta]|eukprot:Sro458_g147000.1 Sensor protein FixL (384) ;mRNA; r:2689-3840